MNLAHVKGLILRYVYMYSRSHFRCLDLFFWPILDLVVWGLVSVYLKTTAGHAPNFFIFLVGAVILWDILHRAQQAVSVSFLEEIWDGNVINIFVAPISLSELISATYIVGFIQAILVLVLLGVLSCWLYSFNVLCLGWQLFPLFLNVLFLGWTLGLFTIGVIIRYGESAQVLAWALAAVIQPFSAVLYPVSILPGWCQVIAYAIPSTYVFEGMRQILQGHPMDQNYLLYAFGLNLLYAVLTTILFKHLFEESRKLGLIPKLGT